MMRIFLVCLLSMLVVPDLLAQSYEKQLQQWYAAREQYLKAENGWLNLVGLLWIEEGKNTFGSDSANLVVFPGKMHRSGGVFERRQQKVWMHASIPIMVNGTIQNNVLVFDADSARQPVLQYSDLRWSFIRRDDKIGIRLRDLQSPAVGQFKGIDHYPVNRGLLVEARFEPHLTPTTIPITNILGQTTRQFSPGLVHVELGGKKFAMIALEEEGQLFFVFGDPTNGAETYAAGRFLKAEKPAGAGTVLLDFNKAYNPPCAFTPFATCPLPPKQNILDVPILAGEKNYEINH